MTDLTLSMPFDDHGRVKLNAIWESAGKPKGKNPSEWLRNKSAKEYVRFLEQNGNFRFDPINVVQGGSDPSIWAVEDLAIEYAAWINVEVKHRVIQGFKAYHRGESKQLSPAEQLLAQAQLMVNIEKEQRVIKAEIAEVKDRLESIETPKVLKEKPEGYDSATNIAKTLSKRFGMSPTHVRNIIRIFVTGEFKDTFEDNPKDSSETFEHDCFDIEECKRVVFEVFEQAVPINRKDTFTHNKYTQNFKIDHETKEWVRPKKDSL